MTGLNPTALCPSYDGFGSARAVEVRSKQLLSQRAVGLGVLNSAEVLAMIIVCRTLTASSLAKTLNFFNLEVIFAPVVC